MQSVNNIWQQVVDLDNIKAAIREAAKHKTRRPDVADVLKHIDQHARKVQEMLVNLAPENIPVPDRSLAWRPRKHEPKPRWDPNSQKWRQIQKPDFKYEQIIHHAVVRVVAPFIMRGMYTYVCGSVPGRGPTSGAKTIRRWIRDDPRNVKYVAQLDIHHFYDSIDHQIVKDWLKKKIHDKRVLFLLCFIIDTTDGGLPLGFYTSQWLANFLLQPLDHYIKEQLHVTHYLRYMDDMILTGSNKRELHRAVEAIREYLAKNYKLELKATWQIFRFEYTDRRKKKRGRALDVMGYVFHRENTELRRRLMLRITRKARRIKKKERMTAHDAAAMVSYMGWIDHTDTYQMYLRRVKPFVNIQSCKRRVAIKNRREQKKRDRLEEGIRNTGGKAAGAGHHQQPGDRVPAPEHCTGNAH